MRKWLRALFARKNPQYFPEAIIKLDIDLHEDEDDLASVEPQFRPKLKAWRRRMHRKMKNLLLRAELILKRNPRKIADFVNVHMDDMAETLDGEELSLTASSLSGGAKEWVRRKTNKMHERLEEWEEALGMYERLVPEK